MAQRTHFEPTRPLEVGMEVHPDDAPVGVIPHWRWSHGAVRKAVARDHGLAPRRGPARVGPI